MDYAAARTERPHVSITEVGTRDGFQTEPELIPAAVKAEVIDGLIDAGLRHIEATSFVSPRAVPQLADAHETLSLLKYRDRACIHALAHALGLHPGVAAKVVPAGPPRPPPVITTCSISRQRRRAVNLRDRSAATP